MTVDGQQGLADGYERVYGTSAGSLPATSGCAASLPADSLHGPVRADPAHRGTAPAARGGGREPGQPALAGRAQPGASAAGRPPRRPTRARLPLPSLRAPRVRARPVADRDRPGRAADGAGRGGGDRARLRPRLARRYRAAGAGRRQPGRVLRRHVPRRGLQRRARRRSRVRAGDHGRRQRQLDGDQPARRRRAAGRLPACRTAARSPTRACCAGRGPTRCSSTSPTTPTSTGCAPGSRSATPPAGVHRYDWPSPHQSFSPAVVFGGFGCNGGARSRSTRCATSPTCARSSMAWRAAACPPRAASRSARTRDRPRLQRAAGRGRARCRAATRSPSRVGGVRFPEVDLPLGRLEPVSLSPSVTTERGAVCGNSGGFTPFTAATVARRYSRRTYLARYARALETLERRRYLRPADRRSTLEAAAADYAAARG